MATGILYRSAFVYIIFYSAATYAQAAEKYDLNDPRNPDCPCHKYQRLAEDEYKQLLTKKENSVVAITAFVTEKNADKNTGIAKQNGENSPAVIKNNSSSGPTVLHSKKGHSHTRRKHKKKSKAFYRFKKIVDVGHWAIWKELKNPSSCYHWK